MRKMKTDSLADLVTMAASLRPEDCRDRLIIDRIVVPRPGALELERAVQSTGTFPHQ